VHLSSVNWVFRFGTVSSGNREKNGTSQVERPCSNPKIRSAISGEVFRANSVEKAG
jgi:hypothetical protein